MKVLLVGAMLVVVVAGAFGIHSRFHPQARTPAAAQQCFVTGLGSKVCGPTAVAYCEIHADGYITDASDIDARSLQACVQAGWEPSSGQQAAARVAFGSQDPL